MTDTITDDLRERIEEAEARNAERAADIVPVEAGESSEEIAEAADAIVSQATRTVSDAASKVTAFAKEHPAIAIAGGVVVGLAIASMFKGPRRLAAKGGAKAAGLAAVGGEMALAYALDAYAKAQEAGREGARQLDDLGDSVGDTARKLKREASYRAGNASDAARIKARETSKAIARKLGRS